MYDLSVLNSILISSFLQHINLNNWWLSIGFYVFMFTEVIYPICLPLTCELLNEPLLNKFVTVAGWGLKQKGKFNIAIEDLSE